MRNRYILCLVLLVSVLSLSACGGGSAGPAGSPSGDTTSASYSVTLIPNQNIAQINSSIVLRAKVLDGNGVPKEGVQVTFTNLSEPSVGYIKSVLRTLGLVKRKVSINPDTTVNTDKNGIATVYISATSYGFATIQAEVNSGVGTVSDKKTVLFSDTGYPTTSTSPTLTLHVSSDGDNFDGSQDFILFKSQGDNQRVIRADVQDATGNPLSNVVVAFGSDSTQITFPNATTNSSKQPIATTNENGQAFVTLQADPSILSNIAKIVNITASGTVDSQTVANVLTLFLEPVVVSPTLSSLTAIPTSVNTGQTSTINAGVMLSTGAPVPDGTSVNFSTTCGSVSPFGQTTKGLATATFTAPQTAPASGICTVTGMVAGVTIGITDINITSPPVPLSVQPGTQTISGATGGTATFTIFGGTPGYTVTSNNPAVAFNTTPGNGIWDVSSNGDPFIVTIPSATAATSVALTVRDSAGTTAAVTLTITGPNPLVITPKTSTVVSSGSAQTFNFTITGGTGGYITTSSDPSQAFNTTAGDGVWSGSSVTVTFPANVTAGTITLNVFDSSGSTTTATITILAPTPGALLISPNIVSVVSSASSQQLVFNITGGTSSYVTTSSDPSKAFNTTAGNDVWNGTPITVTFPANVTAGTVTLNVLDSVGGKTTATITILAPGASSVLSVTPATVSVTGVNTAADQVTFTISGGVTPYQSTALSSDTAVVDNASVSGNSFTIDPKPVFTSTPVTMTVLDHTGAPATATVTVTPATSSLGINPGSIAVTTGTSIAFNIIGGTSPYKVYSSNTGIVALGGNPYLVPPGTNPFIATTPGTGTAIITVVDADAKTVTASVTVNAVATPPTADFLIGCDASVTVPTGATRTFLCTLTSQNGFSAPVTLSCPGLPSGTTCSGFNPVSPVTPAANLTTSVIVTINNASTATGSYPFHVLGISGTLSHTSTSSIALTVP